MIPKKYRAWDNKTKSIRDVLVIDWLNGLVDLEGGIIERDFKEIQLMQYTGLRDKNRVEIFEGNIVAVENHQFQRKENSGVGMEIEGVYVVGWNQHDLTWCVGDLLLARLKHYVRVIGNIYENPELLEVE